jgi:hypothetical protein
VTDAGALVPNARYFVGKARRTRVAQLLGRDSVVERIAAAVDRARAAGGGTVVVCGPGGVGTSAVVEVALRPFGMKVSRTRGAVPPDGDAAVWWIDDAQRIPPADVERLESATVATSRVVLLSGRAPLGTSLAAVVRDAVRADPSRVVDVAPLGPQDALAVVGRPCAPSRGGARRRRGRGRDGGARRRRRSAQ